MNIARKGLISFEFYFFYPCRLSDYSLLHSRNTGWRRCLQDKDDAFAIVRGHGRGHGARAGRRERPVSSPCNSRPTSPPPCDFKVRRARGPVPALYLPSSKTLALPGPLCNCKVRGARGPVPALYLPSSKTPALPAPLCNYKVRGARGAVPALYLPPVTPTPPTL